jgi:hypothetical protein|eukprot:SAG25_NODE_658_length_6112_cov_137.492932_10_plen_53_part_00
MARKWRQMAALLEISTHEAAAQMISAEGRSEAEMNRGAQLGRSLTDSNCDSA